METNRQGFARGFNLFVNGGHFLDLPATKENFWARAGFRIAARMAEEGKRPSRDNVTRAADDYFSNVESKFNRED